MYKKESKTKIRLKAAILQKQEKTYRQICSSLDVFPSTLSYWLNRMHTEGMQVSHHRVHPGKKSFLSNSHRCKNNWCRIWSIRMIIDHVKKKYHAKYAAREMRDLLHRIGFSSKKSWFVVCKSASNEQKMRFKKTQKEQSENIPNWYMWCSVWMNHLSL